MRFNNLTVKLFISGCMCGLLSYYSNGQGMAVSPVVTGQTEVEKIENNSNHNWFNKNYSAYEMDSSVINQIKKVSDDNKIIAFAGTWCPDTHRELPALYKIIDAAGIPRDNVKLYFLDSKMKGPGVNSKNYKIKKVPTIIVYKGEKEVGRIIEKPTLTLEKELLKLMN